MKNSQARSTRVRPVFLLGALSSALSSRSLALALCTRMAAPLSDEADDEFEERKQVQRRPKVSKGGRCQQDPALVARVCALASPPSSCSLAQIDAALHSEGVRALTAPENTSQAHSRPSAQDFATPKARSGPTAPTAWCSAAFSAHTT